MELFVAAESEGIKRGGAMFSGHNDKCACLKNRIRVGLEIANSSVKVTRCQSRLRGRVLGFLMTFLVNI